MNESLPRSLPATTEMTKIGVFDSGFGGLTVLKALLELVPDAEYLYFGDTARLPYGSKSVETVAKYACEAARFLEQQGAELLVIACNTATALAFEQIRQTASVKVVGVIEPGAQQAVAVSSIKKVVVIGTEATISSHAYRNALAKHQVESREKACPLLVPLVEEGWTDHAVTQQVAGIYLAEAFADGFSSADVLLLGCTHYPLLKPVLQRVAPKSVTLVDSAESTALTVSNLLGKKSENAGRFGEATHQHPHDDHGKIKFFVTDSAQKFQRLGKLFLGRPMTDVTHIELKE
ncbi:MAG: glutamate racemase [Acidobacteriaceae bacterium]|nr:glutamate racemase [Acidobacteriaceae bacterium]